jgi:hypothetical protein
MKINKLTGERDSTSRSSIFAEAKTAHGLKAHIIIRFSPKGTSINSEPPKGTTIKTITYGAVIDHLWY